MIDRLSANPGSSISIWPGPPKPKTNAPFSVLFTGVGAVKQNG
jgi:hypothetical protein